MEGLIMAPAQVYGGEVGRWERLKTKPRSSMGVMGGIENLWSLSAWGGGGTKKEEKINHGRAVGETKTQ